MPNMPNIAAVNLELATHTAIERIRKARFVRGASYMSNSVVRMPIITIELLDAEM